MHAIQQPVDKHIKRSVYFPDEAKVARERAVNERDELIGFLIHDVSRLRRTAFDRLLKPLSLNRAQWSALVYLNQKDGVNLAIVAEDLNLSRATIGSLTDRLERLGLVLRTADPRDGRGKIVHLAPKGRDLVGSLKTVSDQFDQATLKHVQPAELMTLIDALRKLKHCLQYQLKQWDVLGKYPFLASPFKASQHSKQDHHEK
jgi:DNA-binding MarR family transcriptional regulator